MLVPCKKNQKFHYSPLRYPGGKSFLYPLLDELIQKRGIGNTVYIEPYAGGAGAALALLFLEKVDEIVINDYDRAIFAFWKSVVEETERFLDRLRGVRVCMREWHRQRAVYYSSRPRRFDLGFATFFLNRTNVSGILEGGPIGGARQQSKYKISARFNKTALCDRIEQIGSYRSRISISNEDGLAVARRFLRRDDTFVYLDPPYFDKGATLYMNHYLESDHRKLAKLLNERPQSNWALTYDNNAVINELYSGRYSTSFSPHHSAYKSRRGKEVLILSEALAP